MTIITLSFLAFGCADDNTLEKYRTFGVSDRSGAPDFNTPFTAPYIVAHHSLGLSRIHLIAVSDAVGQYVEGGSGEALPVSVFLDLPTDLSGSVPRVHRSLALNGDYQFSGAFTDSENWNVALALAKEVLERSYCLGGVVTENSDAQIGDVSGGRSVARDRPAISVVPPNNEGWAPGWRVQLRCGLWSKP